MVRVRIRGRAWCFTVNNFTNADVDAIRRFQANAQIRYVVAQQEVAATGTNHLQGYVEFFRPMRLGLVRKLISPRVHWECRCGTQGDAIAYCKKVESRVVNGIVHEWGTPARSKCSVDLIQSVLDGSSMKDLALDFPTQFLRNSSGIKALKEAVVERRAWPMEVVVFWGPTGTGKTMTAWQRWPKAYSVSWPVGGTWWWQDYDGEETVICDEFASQIKLQTMLRFLDRTPFRVFYKGGSTQFRSKRIIICSNFDPVLWFPKSASVGLDALKRRLVEFATVYEFPTRFNGVGTPERVHDERFEELDISDGDSDFDFDSVDVNDGDDVSFSSSDSDSDSDAVRTDGQATDSMDEALVARKLAAEVDKAFEREAYLAFGAGMDDYIGD